MTSIHRIEIVFAAPVELTAEARRQLHDVASALCKGFVKQNPGRTMWPFGFGAKILSMPFTAQDDEEGVSVEFDDTIYEIECVERADYAWPCAKCGLPQGDHSSCITPPPAGGCEFEAAR